jgi:hypothetical protein
MDPFGDEKGGDEEKAAWCFIRAVIRLCDFRL